MSKKNAIPTMITTMGTVGMILISIWTQNVAFLFFGIAIFFGGISIILNNQKKKSEEDERKASERRIKKDLEGEEKRKDQEEERKIQYDKIKKQEEEKKRNIVQLTDDMKKHKDRILFKYDKNKDGIVDEIEKNIFVEVLKNNQSELIEIDKDKVHQFIKLSSYLKTKKANIQSIYNVLCKYDVDKYAMRRGNSNSGEIDVSLVSLRNPIGNIKLIRENLGLGLKESKELHDEIKENATSDIDFINKIREVLGVDGNFTDMEDISYTLDNEIEVYKSLVFHSLNMIVTLKNGDLITFYEIYEMYDKLGVFNSNWENEVSKKLSNIESKIGSLIQSINKMNDEIVGELISLNYVMESSIGSLENSVNYELQGIKSSVNFNNLLTSVNTYQLSKLNSKTSKPLNGR